MCIDNDNSEHVTKYVNDQLRSLYEIAGDCVQHYEEKSIDRAEQLGYDFALREHYCKSETLPVKFEFDTPVIEFICNHDAILHLTIKSTTLLSTGVDSTEPSQDDDWIRKDKPEKDSKPGPPRFEGEVSVRVPFRKLEETSEVNDSGQYTTNSFILLLSKVVQAEHTNPEVMEEYRPYLTAYLGHLVNSGHHILHSLPDFSHRGTVRKREVDFSEISSPCERVKYFDVSLVQLVKHVEDVWLEAAWLEHQYSSDSTLNSDPADHNTIAVATWRHDWHASAPFDAEFGAPGVQLRCEHAAILTFSIEHITFYPGESREKSFHDFKIAIIVDIIPESREGGAITTLKLNTATSAKFAKDLSEIEGVEDDDDWAVKILVDFMTQEYLFVLESGGFHLFYQDKRAYINPVILRGWVDSEDYGSQIVTSTEMRGLQQIVALSHASLDKIFMEHNWVQSLKTDGHFEIRYGVPKVRLLSNRRALVFFRLEYGKIWIDGVSNKEYAFKDWTLTFEVDLCMRDVELGVELKAREQTKLRQLHIDFSTAEFNHRLSEFNRNLSNNHRAIRAVVKAVSHLKANFIECAPNDVLYSVMISEDQSTNRRGYALSDATFHIYRKVEVDVTSQNYNQVSDTDEPLIVILGVTGRHKLPSSALHYSSYWLRRSDSIGTLALSSEVFLKGRLLPFLAGINRVTTIVSEKHGAENRDWQVTTWQKMYKDHLTHPTDWELITSKSSHGRAFEYKWCHSDIWEYAGAYNNRTRETYHKALRTDNRLTIPMSFSNGRLDITIKGASDVTISQSLAKSSAKLKAWVHWTITISVITTDSGLRIEAANVSNPQYGSKVDGSIDADQSPTDLKGIFSDLPLNDLKISEDIPCYLCPGFGSFKANPRFTAKGDLFLELREYGQTPVTGLRTTPLVKPLGTEAHVKMISSSSSSSSSTTPRTGPTTPPQTTAPKRLKSSNKSTNGK